MQSDLKNVQGNEEGAAVQYVLYTMQCVLYYHAACTVFHAVCTVYEERLQYVLYNEEAAYSIIVLHTKNAYCIRRSHEDRQYSIIDYCIRRSSILSVYEEAEDAAIQYMYLSV